MLLKSIKFNNFRCFRDEVKIDISCNKDQNIVVILGDNTNGKSTIVQAFVWCFYGVENFDNPEIYNRGIAKEMPLQTSTVASVEVVFEHENTLYTARRTQEFFKSIDGTMVCPSKSSNFHLNYVDGKTGETKPCGKTSMELVKTINAIMPRDLAPYFFFAGEKNNELTTKSLSSAVKSLLGIEALQKMREHIHGNTAKVSSNSVMGEYEKRQVSVDNIRANAEWDKKVKAEQELQDIENRLSEISQQIKDYEEKIDEVNTALRAAEPTKILQARRDKIKREIVTEQQQLNFAYNRFISDFNDKAVQLFTIPLLDDARAKLNSMDLSDKGIKGIEAQAIRQLLKRGFCLCGTDLKEGTLAYKNVEKYIDILPPQSVGTLVGDLMDKIQDSETIGKGYVNREADNYRSVQFSIDKLNDLEREESDLLEQLKNMPDVGVAQYEADLRQYKVRIENLRSEERSKIARKQQLNSAIETARNNYNMFKSKADQCAIYAKYYAYAQRIYEWISITYDEKEKNIRTRLQKEVTELFNHIYSGNRVVEIDSTYNIRITPKADTGGLKVIQYFSYVGGLVKVARDVMKERNPGEVYGEEYPLVLDAAFSHTDTKHTKAIAKELSTVTNQLVFAVMDKDWEHVGEQIKENIAKTYKLVKINEDQVVIEGA
jgi:DNA sulfur modification protein DndD